MEQVVEEDLCFGAGWLAGWCMQAVLHKFDDNEHDETLLFVTVIIIGVLSGLLFLNWLKSLPFTSFSWLKSLPFTFFNWLESAVYFFELAGEYSLLFF